MPADNQEELFYWVNEDDEELGSISRYQAHHSFKLHRSIGILLLNEKQEMLFQQRSSLKDLDGGLWSFAVGGHVAYGDSYEETAVRELKEELGIVATLTFLLKVKFNTGKEYQMAGIFSATIPSTTSLQFDPVEIQATSWVPITEIPNFMESHPCTNWTVETLKQTGFL